MSAHTPGPWNVRSEEAISIDAGGSRVCMLTHLTRLFDRRDPEEVAANARLIAAAPDMLAALTAIRGATDEDELIDAHQKMHDAIAEAEGSSA